MDTYDKLKSLKNPFKNADFVVHREIRTSALKSLWKLYWFDLKTKSKKDSKISNIFIENKKLVKLVKKDSLTIKDFDSINKLILKDFSKLQKDLDYAKKADLISKKKLEKRREESNKIVYDLWGMFKPAEWISCIWKKASTFCKRNKVKLALCWALVTLWGLATFVQTADNVTASAESENKKPLIKNEKQVLKISKTKDNYSVLKQVLNTASHLEFDKVDPSSKTFEKSKNLYLWFMKDLVKKADSEWNLKLWKSDLSALLKAEYLYNSWVKKNLENKSEGLKWEKKDKNLRKIDTTNEQMKKLKDNFNELEEWKKIWFNYQKHWITIDVKSEGDSYIISWLNNFNY